VATLVQPVTATGDFTVHGALRLPDGTTPTEPLRLAPFHRTHRKRYALYYDLVTPAQFAARDAARAAAREAEQRLLASTIGTVTVGDPASEAAVHFQSNPATRPIGRNEGRTQRGGTGWFSFDLPLSDARSTLLVVTYFTEPGLPAPLGPFDILADGTLVAHYAPDQSASGFHRVTYALPMLQSAGKRSTTIRFQAVGTGRIAPVFEVRTVAG
jgi:hypothetical protein